MVPPGPVDATGRRQRPWSRLTYLLRRGDLDGVVHAVLPEDGPVGVDHRERRVEHVVAVLLEHGVLDRAPAERRVDAVGRAVPVLPVALEHLARGLALRRAGLAPPPAGRSAGRSAAWSRRRRRGRSTGSGWTRGSSRRPRRRCGRRWPGSRGRCRRPWNRPCSWCPRPRPGTYRRPGSSAGRTTGRRARPRRRPTAPAPHRPTPPRRRPRTASRLCVGRACA